MPKKVVGTPAQPGDVIAPRLTVLDFFKKHFLYKERSVSQIKKLIPCFELEKYTAKQQILKEGEIGDRLIIVAKGLVQLTQQTPEGKPKVLTRLGANEVLGEYSFVTAKHVLTATVSAYEPTLILSLRKDVYFNVRNQNFMEPIKQRVEFSRKLLIRQSLKKLPFMAKVTNEQLADVDKYFKLEDCPKATTVFREGDMGDKFYVLIAGKVVVTTTDDLGFVIEVARLEPVSSFGEQALITKDSRNATVTTLEDSQFYTLSEREFQTFLKSTPKAKEELDASIKANKAGNYFADSVPIFKSMSKRHQHLLGVVADLVTAKPNTVIKEEGTQKGLNFYLIVSGTCDVFVGGDFVKTMGPGDYFGEVGIISHEASSATVKVSEAGECILMAVPKDDFLAIFSDEPAFLSELKIRLDGQNCSLADLLQHPQGRESFLRHCQQEYAKENVDFWQDVLALENIKTRRMRKSVLNAMKVSIPETKAKKVELLEKYAHNIYEKYLAPNSPEEVNLPSEVKDKLLKRFDDNNLAYDMFEEARESIYELIEADNFQRYKASDSFETLIQQIGTYKRGSVHNPNGE